MIDARELMPDLQREAILAEAKPFDPLSRLEEFSQKYPFAMQILRIGGVHPTEDSVMDNPYTGKPHDESFTNVGEHVLAVASAVNVMAVRLHNAGVLSETDVELATQRALVHDANKRLEVMRRNAVRERVIDDAYSPKAYETIRPILLASGIEQDLVEYMVTAGAETAHLSFGLFLHLRDGIPTLTPGRMVDKIIHLADDMTSTSIPLPGERAQTFYLTPWERIIASDFPNRYPQMWREGFGFNESGDLVIVSDINSPDPSLRQVRSEAYYQPFTSNEISREIQGVLGPQSQERPEYFVKNLVNTALVLA